MTKNINIKPDEIDLNGKPNVRSSSLDASKTLLRFPVNDFSKVLKRRKSRQSNFGPGCVDFNYAGDSAQYNHMINPPTGKPDNIQLNYSLNLRVNKNLTEYQAA